MENRKRSDLFYKKKWGRRERERHEREKIKKGERGRFVILTNFFSNLDRNHFLHKKKKKLKKKFYFQRKEGPSRGEEVEE